MTTPNPLAFVDCEATSLNKLTGDVIEVAWALGRTGPVKSTPLPHTLLHADPRALEVNRYYERDLDYYCTDLDPGVGIMSADQNKMTSSLRFDLTGATLVAENYGYDQAMLLRKLGYEPWHYRPIELSSVAMTVFDLDRPESMRNTAQRLRHLGFTIPEPDHSAGADVDCLRECYYALREVRARHGHPVTIAQHRQGIAATVAR